METTVSIRYSCHLCGIEKAAVDVPARGEEDLEKWMAVMIHALGNDHQKRSPNCHPQSLSDIMIPMTGTDRVGGPVIQ